MRMNWNKFLTSILVAASAPTTFGEVITRVCVLTGSQETPAPIATPAMGCGRFVIDTDANTMTYRIVYTGLTAAETAAHIHGYSGPGAGSGIVHNLPLGNVKTGVWNYPEANESDILNGLTYVNVHTLTNPGGEIRGQIVAMVALLDGGQEVPAVATPATGFALFNINPTTNTLDYYISYGGLTSAETAAHIHGMALPGSNAGIQHFLPAANPKVGSWNYPEALELALLDGQAYVNIHTVNFGGGEIRGQIVSSVNPMDGLQETPAPLVVPGAGCGLCSFNRATNFMGYDVRYANLTTAETAAHIHGYSAVGVSSGVQIAIPAANPKRGTWNFPAARLNDVIFNALTYFNIHTVANPGGELRGQISGGRPVPCSPLVTAHPSDVTVSVGHPVSFSVTANDRNGGSLQYAWRRNGVALVNGGAISGVNTPTLTINPVAAVHAGSYDVVVTNFCGTTTSNSATLTIGVPCDSIDFNNDGLFPDTQDIDDFLSVFGGGPCSNDPNCGDIDFNNDGLFPDTTDIDILLNVFGGGSC